MHWGHKIRTNDGEVEVTRADYNRAFGAPVPPAPQVDDCLRYVLAIWRRLSARRPPSQGAVSPLPFQEIEAFARLSHEPITPEDLELIESMDNAFLHAVSEEQKAAMERQRERQKSKPPTKR